MPASPARYIAASQAIDCDKVGDENAASSLRKLAGRLARSQRRIATRYASPDSPPVVAASGGAISITVIVDIPLWLALQGPTPAEYRPGRPMITCSLRLEQVAHALRGRPPGLFGGAGPRDLVIVVGILGLRRRLDAGDVERTHHLSVGADADILHLEIVDGRVLHLLHHGVT